MQLLCWKTCLLHLAFLNLRMASLRLFYLAKWKARFVNFSAVSLILIFHSSTIVFVELYVGTGMSRVHWYIVRFIWFCFSSHAWFYRYIECFSTELCMFCCSLWHVQIKDVISKCPEAISRPLLKARLSEKQWESVMFINHALRQEYECRRQMLLQRLDVTILSFQWSDRAKVSVDTYYLHAYVIFVYKLLLLLLLSFFVLLVGFSRVTVV